MKQLLVLVFLILAGPAAATQKDLFVHAPTYGYLNLRSGPGVDHKIIKQMRHGTGVELIERSHGWYRIVHGNKIGWAHGNYFTHEPLHHKPKHKKKKAHKPVYKVHAPYDHFLNLRTGPGTGYHVIGTMPHGSKLRLIGPKHGSWAKVRHVHSGAIGWAHVGYMVKH